MNRDPNVMARHALTHLHEFRPDLPDRTIPELRQILAINDVVKLSFNESPYDPSPLVLAAIREAAGQIHYYNDPEGKELRRALAGLYGVEDRMIFLANGGDEAIALLGMSLLSAGDQTIMPVPTFGQYRHVTRLMGAEPVAVPVQGDMTVDLPAILGAITQATKMIFLCNPNNPTGRIIKKDELRKFVAAVPGHIVIMLDEAYAEFVTDGDFLSGMALLGDFPNIVVIRTFSKIYGMAGLRLGYGLAHPKLVAMVNQARSPFNVNLLAQTAGLAALADQDYVAGIARLNALERRRLSLALANAAFTVYPSETNFILADTRRDSLALCETLAGKGIIIRPGTAWNLPTFVRISVGSHEQNTRLLEAIQA